MVGEAGAASTAAVFRGIQAAGNRSVLAAGRVGSGDRVGERDERQLPPPICGRTAATIWIATWCRRSKTRARPIRAQWQEHLSGRRNWAYSLWTVLMFQAWLEAQSA
jgi:hypothetical protein